MFMRAGKYLALSAVVFAAAMFPARGQAESSERKILPGTIIEPVLLHPDQLSLNYRLGEKCDLKIYMARSKHGERLTELKINLCSQPIDVSEACIEKFAEPNLEEYAVLFSDLTMYRGNENPYAVTFGVQTRMDSATRKAGEMEPPFAIVEFDGSGVSKCDEILELEIE